VGEGAANKAVVEAKCREVGGAGGSKQMSHAAAVNYGNQMNPSQSAFAASMGGGITGQGAAVSSKQISHAAAINHGNQLTPSHSAYAPHPTISEGQFQHHAVRPCAPTFSNTSLIPGTKLAMREVCVSVLQSLAASITFPPKHQELLKQKGREEVAHNVKEIEKTARNVFGPGTHLVLMGSSRKKTDTRGSDRDYHLVTNQPVTRSERKEFVDGVQSNPALQQRYTDVRARTNAISLTGTKHNVDIDIVPQKTRYTQRRSDYVYDQILHLKIDSIIKLNL
jgi:GrpB-like predicted nucleotidyltransferase (UPF0157 family)